MTFTTTPRSRSPVLSIRTQYENEEALRLEIVAATGQQERVKRRKPILMSTPTIHEESDSEEKCSDCSCQKHGQGEGILSRSKATVPPRHTLSRSIRSITGTVRGEIASAKQFFRLSSRRPLVRARARSNSVVSENSLSSRFEESSSTQGTSFNTQPNAVELSSDPLSYQLEDNQRSARPSEDFSISSSSAYEYEKRLEIESLYYGQRGLEAKTLSFKSYSCDGCQHPLSGGDFYDFCAHCGPGDRVLCYNCAQQGGCSRHRPGNMTIDLPISARSSPAPPYTHRTGGMYEVLKEEPEQAAMAPRSNHCSDPTMPPTHRDDDESTGSTMMSSSAPMADSKSVLLERQLDGLSRRHQELLDQMQAMMGEIVNKKAHTQDTTVSSRSEQREQQAVVREQQLAIREQELLLRERENLCRDRETLMVRNLQSLAITQELAKHGQFGAQFESGGMKYATDSDEKANVFRSRSSASEGTVDLSGGLADQYTPHKDIVEAVAHAEACMDSETVDEHGIRSRPAQKRKKGDSTNSQQSTTPSNQSSRHGSQKQADKPTRPLPQDDQENSDEEGPEPSKRPKPDSSEPDVPQRIFACPYHKHEPLRYSPQNLTEKHYRGCSGHYLPDIPRLKQHLKRVHWRPEHHCPRCYKVFDKPDQLSKHHAQPVACTAEGCPFPEKMDKAQQRLIHVKKPRVHPETLWYNIYTTLFPGSPKPDSPYAEQVDTITPPLSAAPSSVNAEEVSQLMIRILIERLDKHENRLDHDWLSVNTEREFIMTEVGKSVTELFGKMSWSPNRSPTNIASSAPPSVLVSPVDSLPPPEVPLMSGTSDIASSHRSTMNVPVAGPPPATPQLQAPKPHHKPILWTPPQTVSSTPQHMHHNTPDSSSNLPAHSRYLELRNHVQNSNTADAPIDEWAHGITGYHLTVPGPQQSATSSPMTDESVFSHTFDPEVFEQAAKHISVDVGWDDQSPSYLEGDDQHAMAGTVVTASQGVDGDLYGKQASTLQQHPRAVQRSRDFVPVSLKTLEESPQLPQDGSQTNSRNKSIVSLVDSGYGSGSSDRSGYRIESALPTLDEFEVEDYSLGHQTFQEQWELGNPWNR